MKDLQTSGLEQQGMELVELPTNLVFSCPKSVYNKKKSIINHICYNLNLSLNMVILLSGSY